VVVVPAAEPASLPPSLLALFALVVPLLTGPGHLLLEPCRQAGVHSLRLRVRCRQAADSNVEKRSVERNGKKCSFLSFNFICLV